ncbi:hypothetical protein [Chitinophaga caseinilytica]|uniref:Type IX secretion system membrane protein PorP/SprF n=1 Tax=Chitinophaga caseinilytica TaxID=2267521 RepID=A0ABZ2Z8R6_9BACT
MMLKKLTIILALAGAGVSARAQELYVQTEPASNMPANSIGLRLTNKFYPMDHASYTGYRLQPEVMLGISKKLMVHASGYFSNVMENRFKAEGAGLYAKYRFLSVDDMHSHFRMAAFAKGSIINNPYAPPMGPDHDHTAGAFNNQDLDLDGMTSGVSAGVIATQLVHKLAVSGSLAYDRYMNNTQHNLPYVSRSALNYTLSAGYLLLPRSYKSYKQTNLNLYVELLGKSNLDQYRSGYYVDVAPAVQLIINSNSRIDLSYRTQLFGDMARMMDQSFLVRYEYNLYNIFKK